MDFSATQLSGLLNNINHEKTKYIGLLHKIKLLLEISVDHKLIQTHLNQLILTSDPNIIYHNINFTHPVLKILQEFLEKMTKAGTGVDYFVKVTKNLIIALIDLLDNGVSAKYISDCLKDIDLNKRISCGKPVDLDDFDRIEENLSAFINSIINNTHVTSLLLTCIKSTNSFDIEKIRIIKIPTECIEDSYITEGIIIPTSAVGKIKTLADSSVGIFNCPLDIPRPELKGTVLLNNAKDLVNYSKSEVARIKEIISRINVNAIVVSGTVNEMFVDFLDSRHILILKVFSKFDLKRICDISGSRIFTSLAPAYDQLRNHSLSAQGWVKEIKSYKEGGFKFTKIVGNSKISTIVLKSSVIEIVDEYERKIVKVLECINEKYISIGKDLGSESERLSFETTIEVGDDNIVSKAVSEALKDDMELFSVDRKRCLQYAINFISTILEVNDYLVAKRDQLDIKPQQNGHWDETDH